MEKILAMVVVVMLGFVGLIFYGIVTTDHDSELVNKLKYDACVEEMTKAIPDPNDTENRSMFLKDCYEH